MRIFPSKFPEYKKDNPAFRAERNVFESISRLQGDYTVYYNANWLGPDKSGRIRDGEIDFILAHPQKGILVLEVKGGGVEYDSEKDEWRSKNRYGESVKIKNPYEQAKTNKYALLNQIKVLQPNVGRMLYGHAVVFPDLPAIEPNESQIMPIEITVFGSQLAGNITEVVERIFSYWQGIERTNLNHAPGDTIIRQLDRLFGHDIVIHEPLITRIRENNEEILKLTQEQFQILDLLSFQKRARIIGCAGAGKTFLAIEKTRRLLAQGLKVLFLCYNRPLRDYLVSCFVIDSKPVIETFHEFCAKIVLESKLMSGLPEKPDPSFYSKVLPGLLTPASQRLEKRYDAVIIDEAQDFEDTWWDGILSFLTDSKDGILYLFSDDNQNLYRRERTKIPISEEPYSLTKNLRNTKQIHQASMSYYTGHLSVQSAGPDGIPVERGQFTSNTRDDRLKELHAILDSHIVKERINPGNIAILSGLNIENGLLAGVSAIGNYKVSTEVPFRTDSIFYGSIARFKGLEKPVVILIDVDHLFQEEQKHKETLYVALTRARARLLILTD